jgi:hypothetical protein
VLVRERFAWLFFQPTRPHYTFAAKGSKRKKLLGLMGAQSRHRSCQLGGLAINSHACDIDWEVHALFFIYAYGKTIHNLPDIIIIYWCGDRHSASPRATPMYRAQNYIIVQLHRRLREGLEGLEQPRITR